MAVHNISDGAVVVAFGADHCPDLAEARERMPELATVWDAVRHAYWVELVPPLPD
ncbi:hypothetical protein [Nocardia sp. NPDC051570]|uniref:hypothetical protein n=1 Tax=Nocardia sp. NPDC051570 TaxID=3364324 RepID=UPI0037893FD4